MNKRNIVLRALAIAAAIFVVVAVFARRVDEETRLMVSTIEERVATLNAIIPQVRSNDLSLYWSVLGTLDETPVFLSLKDHSGQVLLEQNVSMRDAESFFGVSTSVFEIEFNGRKFGNVTVTVNRDETVKRVLAHDRWYLVVVILLLLFVALSEWFGVRLMRQQYDAGLRWIQRRFPFGKSDTEEVGRTDNAVPKFASVEFTRLLEQISVLISENKELEKNTAIARTTQMMAHDVRKPFSLMKSAISVLSHATTIDDVRKNMRIIGPAVERSLTSVNGMLDDIMEIGRAEKPKTEATSAEAIIESSLVEVFQVFADAKISLSYQFGHTHLLNVEASKVQRGISNIVANAVQAMNKQGDIWFATSERNGFIEFKIGNSGPVIPEGDLPKLFEAFFSKGKKGGTGLGLAIAKKVVTAHGGCICCQLTSDKKFVEFVFTLPMGDKGVGSNASHLPATSQEVKSIVETHARGTQSSERKVVADPREAEFERKIVAAAAASGRRIEVVILDDEPLSTQRTWKI